MFAATVCACREAQSPSGIALCLQSSVEAGRQMIFTLLPKRPDEV